MTSTTTRTVVAILATLALTAPVANAMPLRDANDSSRTSSLAGTPAPKQDLRNPDQQAPAPEPKQDLRNPDQQAPAPPVPLKPYAPVTVTKPVPVSVDNGTSPLVYIVPSLVLVAMLGAAVVYTRSSRSSRPARV
ncbi:MAG TPA: hypothetical protein VFX51_16480 [Solirubrobacteraceae bacterium]|nr:hypothetical protein [Solirubrobacteraceae bacterium]